MNPVKWVTGVWGFLAPTVEWSLLIFLSLSHRLPLTCLFFWSSSQTFNSSDYASCPSARCIFIKYNDEGLFQRNLFNLQIYNVVAFLWCVNFVIALGQCTLAGAFASYYWAFKKPSDIPSLPLTQSFMRALRWEALVSVPKLNTSGQCETWTAVE